MWKQRGKKLSQRIASLFSALLLLGLQTVVAPVSAYATPNTNNKIRICHRTASYSNPYTDIEVDKNAADGVAGNSGNEPDHYGEHKGPIFYTSIPKHTEWGDIIPPIAGVHSGLNWTSEGQAIWNSDCNFPNGDLKVDKRVDNNSDGTFELGTADSSSEANTINGLGFRWGLDDEVAARNMGSTAEDVPAGNHTVTEKNVNGYVFVGWYYTTSTSKSCTNPNGTTLPVNIEVEKNETRRITLCNAKEAPKTGTITIHKDAVPHTTNGEYFNFTSNVAGAETFMLDDEPGAGNNNIPESRKFTLPVGQYTFTELEKSGWKLKDIVCSDQNGVQINGSTVTINLSADQNITCNYTNKKRGNVHVTKVTNPKGSDAEFSVTISGNGNITGPITKTITDGQTVSWQVDQGTYSVDEASTPGWDMTGNTCDEVTVSANNLDVYCTITNTQQPSTISGHKFDDRNSNGVKDGDEKYLAGWKITLYRCDEEEEPELDTISAFSLPKNTVQTIEDCDQEVATDWTDWNGSYSFANLKLGNYKVCEQQKDYWTQTYPQTLDGCHKVTVSVPNSSVTADFGNHHHVELQIAKSNDKPNPVFAGDTVTYTVNVTVPEDSDKVYDAVAIDVLPAGFTYVSGSWSANSSVRGDIKDSPTTEPTYGDGSEGVWQLGNMESGEVVTLTYQAKIGLSVTPGTYTNTVVAKGFDSRRCTEKEEEVLRSVELVQSNEHCQRECHEVVSPFADSDVTVAAVLGETTFTPGQVLGASTLANTGTQWAFAQFVLPAIMIAITGVLTTFSRRRALNEGVK